MFATLLALAASSAAGEAPSLRLCLFEDGVERLVNIDPSAYPMTVLACRATHAMTPPQTHASAAAVVLESAPQDSVTLIRARVWRSRPTVRGTPRRASQPIDSLIVAAAWRNRLDPRLVRAVIDAESAYDPAARSPKGALGLMQVLPATGRAYGVLDSRSLFSPEVNIDVGTRYLGDLLDTFEQRLDLALAAYNAGPEAVRRCGGHVPPFPETRAYVNRVLHILDGERR